MDRELEHRLHEEDLRYRQVLIDHAKSGELLTKEKLEEYQQEHKRRLHEITDPLIHQHHDLPERPTV